jgi:hypothetical protein
MWRSRPRLRSRWTADFVCQRRRGRLRHIWSLSLLATLMWMAIPVLAQDSLGVFHTDPAQFFAGTSSRTWIGRGRFMMTNFTDTVIITADTSRHSIVVRRVMVNEDDTVVVSRGRGSVTIGHADSLMPLRWTESRYPEVTGRMRFDAGQWVLEFDGEWKQWSIRLARVGGNSFNALIGRALGSLPPVMFSGLTYQAQPVKSKGR